MWKKTLNSKSLDQALQCHVMSSAFLEGLIIKDNKSIDISPQYLRLEPSGTQDQILSLLMQMSLAD